MKFSSRECHTKITRNFKGVKYNFPKWMSYKRRKKRYIDLGKNKKCTIWTAKHHDLIWFDALMSLFLYALELETEDRLMSQYPKAKSHANSHVVCDSFFSCIILCFRTITWQPSFKEINVKGQKAKNIKSFLGINSNWSIITVHFIHSKEFDQSSSLLTKHLIIVLYWLLFPPIHTHLIILY